MYAATLSLHPLVKSVRIQKSFITWRPLKATNEESTEQDASFIKAPTAPWMKGPLLVQENQRPTTKRDPKFLQFERTGKALFGKQGCGRGKKEMNKVYQGFEKLQRTHSSVHTQTSPLEIKFKFSSQGLFGDTQNKLDKIGIDSKKMPWVKDDKLVIKRVKKERIMSSAELNFDAFLLERLKGEAKKIKKWVKVNKAGVNQSVIDQVRFIWRDNELAMLKFDLPLCRNMERAREITEIKTGGFVVWVNKDALFVYKGCNYRSGLNSHSSMISNIQDQSQDEMLGKTENDGSNLLISGTLNDREADRILDGLGPRFIDWWGRKPLPVDADLLQEVVPGFKPPWRICLPGVRLKLTDDELTHFRMLARPLPTHFVLDNGRNRNLQGMAVAILKLWERCHIAKIALKVGVPNTDNEQMANELKLLTGGTLLLRNKFLIIIYRGKNFLPPHVASIVMERESDLRRYQHQEEAARLVPNEQILVPHELQGNSISGTLTEFQSIHSECMTLKNGNEKVELELRTQKERIEKELRFERQKLFILKKKIKDSEKYLNKLNLAWQSSEPAADHEVLTDEERECLRMIGLKMDSNLILGRRGVFDGVIEGLHQHWKNKEVVKVITMQRRFPQITYAAKLLTAESGGVLVSVDKLKEGHAIIIYRGKNYVRPALVQSKLPNKIDALRISLLMQRIGSMKFFAKQKEQAISNLMDKMSALDEKIYT
ncbi:hypothetical protein Leryth_027064 [Lithospermum erythrorhizon]|nr:hypothetical protein Leryth_027064 [Lithospermum erythrorhizon]